MGRRKLAFTTLETKRLELKEIGEQHKESIYQILSRDDVMQYYGTDKFTDPEEAAAIIQSFSKGFESGMAARWGIILKESGELVGTIGIHNWNKRVGRAEIGYELHPDHWRKGIATEAVHAVLSHSFNELGIFRMGAVVFPENVGSLGMLEKIGFQKEGLLRAYLHQGGRSHDSFMLSLLKTEWMV